MCLPPNAYRADDRAVLEHYAAVASVGLPVTAYNNPIDTKVDLRPELLAKLHAEGFIVGVKEFSGDVRRCYAINELAPGLDLIIGTDDTLLEVAVAGAKGWVATPRSSRAPASTSTTPRWPVTSPPRCRSTARSTPYCAGTAGPSSSRRSSSART